MDHTLASLIQRFVDARQAGPFDYAFHHHHDGREHGFHVVVAAIVHGNEVGSLPAVVSFVEALQSGAATFGGRLTVVLGNPEASAQNRRFLEADLNRVFIESPPDNHEGSRARELQPILASADLFIDLHQTILATDRPFYIFPFDIAGWQWARAIGAASTWVTRAPDVGFSTGTCCSDEYVRLHGGVGLTLELGEKGFTPAAEQRATKALHRLAEVADTIARSAHHAIRLDELARAQPELEFVDTTWAQAFDDPTMALRPGLTNFQHVTERELLSDANTPPIHAPHDGMLLFPKYPGYNADGTAIEPRPGEIVRIVQPLADHPTSVWADQLGTA